MTRRIAATASLIVFAVCLLLGIGVGNDMTTILGRALIGMAGTLVVGWIIGTMAQKMLDENLRAMAGEPEKLKDTATDAKK